MVMLEWACFGGATSEGGEEAAAEVDAEGAVEVVEGDGLPVPVREHCLQRVRHLLRRALGSETGRDQ